MEQELEEALSELNIKGQRLVLNKNGGDTNMAYGFSNISDQGLLTRFYVSQTEPETLSFKIELWNFDFKKR